MNEWSPVVDRGSERLDDCFNATHVALADRMADKRLEVIHRTRQTSGVHGARARQLDGERAAIGGIQLTPNETARLQAVKHIRQGRAFGAELAVQRGDRHRPVARELEQDMDLSLSDPEVTACALGMDADQMRGSFKSRQEYAHIVHSRLGRKRRA
jgi:hypothetical protein